jgi:hypothetical protein
LFKILVCNFFYYMFYPTVQSFGFCAPKSPTER